MTRILAERRGYRQEPQNRRAPHGTHIQANPGYA